MRGWLFVHEVIVQESMWRNPRCLDRNNVEDVRTGMMRINAVLESLCFVLCTRAIKEVYGVY